MVRKDAPSIVIEGLSHSYDGENRVLCDIDLDIGVGMFGLLGTNGAGKTTLMRIICTLLTPTSGRVSVDGFDVVRDRSVVRKRFGYLPQEFGVWRKQTVEEALDLLASLSGMSDSRKRADRVAEVLNAVGLGDVVRRKVKNLSGGMLRRLGVAQALVHDPSIVIMDEPTVGLDPEERLRFRQMMAELSQDRVIILSTHIIADIGASCNKLALIHQGRLEFAGSPEELTRHASNSVFEVAESPEIVRELEERDGFEIVSRSFRDGVNVLRGVTNQNPSLIDASLVEDITLEEAYLAYTLNQGRKICTTESEIVGH